VGGKPFLILGGELGNSSAGTAAQADSILPDLAGMHLNTVLMPVAWEQIEPEEGHFDFSILDHWIDVARQQQLHLVLLWFGSWKNAFSNYAPEWVKSDVKRFPRAIGSNGLPLEILSTFGEETVGCDGRAFSMLMRHVRETDESQQTVLMVQVENEIGYLGYGRDRSVKADLTFQGNVPADLKRGLEGRRLQMSPELAQHFNSAGKTWKEVFGDASDEVFMAFQYAVFVNKVAQQGKAAYALPMYLNAQLPSPFERAGEYPSGGPHPYYQDVYRIAAPSIDFYSPDIYWPNFEYWVQRYQTAGNPIFVPEARLEGSAYNALYTYGEARGFGFSPFGVDSSAAPQARPGIADVYSVLGQFSSEILEAQQRNRIRGLALHASSPRPTQTVALGGYLFQATLSRSWPARTLLTDDGAMMIFETKPNEFYILGSGLIVDFIRDPDTDDHLAGIAKIEQVSKRDQDWVADRELNGDQTNQGRQLLMAAHELHLYRVKLYSYSRH
jgi:beta-galactosidase GanA